MMYKHTYHININTETDEFDPNLDRALKDIFRRKKNESSPGNFDFEVVCLYDGFIENSKQHRCFNIFLHDMLEKGNPYFSSKNEEKFDVYVGYVKDFLSHYDYPDRDIDLAKQSMQYRSMDVFQKINVNGKDSFCSVTVRIPEEIIMEKDIAIRQALQVEPEYLTMFLRPEVIFKHVMAPLYHNLYNTGLIDNEELRDITKYKIGFH